MKTFSVVRNAITKVFATDKMGKKSDMEGREFPVPIMSDPKVVTLELKDGSSVEAIVGSFIDDVKWVGQDFLALLNKDYRRIFMSVFTDNVDEETGIFDEEAWQRDATKFTEGAVTLSELVEQREGLESTNNEIINSPDFMENDNPIVVKSLGENAVSQDELCKMLKQNSAKINALKKQEAEISARYEARAAKRKKRTPKTSTTTPSTATATDDTEVKEEAVPA